MFFEVETNYVRSFQPWWLICLVVVFLFFMFLWWPFQWVYAYQDATLCLAVVAFIIIVLLLTLVEINWSIRPDSCRALKRIKLLLESNWKKRLCDLVSRLRCNVQTTGAAQRIAAWKLIHSRVQIVQDQGRKDVRVKKKQNNETK